MYLHKEEILINLFQRIKNCVVDIKHFLRLKQNYYKKKNIINCRYILFYSKYDKKKCKTTNQI